MVYYKRFNKKSVFPAIWLFVTKYPKCLQPTHTTKSKKKKKKKKKKTEKERKKKQINLSKQRSTLSDMSNNIQSCSSAITCMSLSSPVPMVSHSKSVSGSMSAIICSRYFDVNIFLMWLYHWQNFYSLNCPMANNSLNCYKISNLFCISIFCSLKIKTISHEKNVKKNIISMYFH